MLTVSPAASSTVGGGAAAGFRAGITAAGAGLVAAGGGLVAAGTAIGSIRARLFSAGGALVPAAGESVLVGGVAGAVALLDAGWTATASGRAPLTSGALNTAGAGLSADGRALTSGGGFFISAAEAVAVVAVTIGGASGFVVCTSFAVTTGVLMLRGRLTSAN